MATTTCPTPLKPAAVVEKRTPKLIPVNSADGRLHVVDALRGFAIVSIMLLHSIAHFDLDFDPQGLPAWMSALDGKIEALLLYLFSGKSYAIFALLFGLTFSIQAEHERKKGKDFRARFAWRLLLLLGIGLVNSAVYEGDILSMYAVIAMMLIPLTKLDDTWVFIIAILLMLQPYEWINVARGIGHPDMAPVGQISLTYYQKTYENLTGPSWTRVFVSNLTNGKIAAWLWTWEEGRFFQTASLFLLGMLAGRKALFAPREANKVLWRMALIAAFPVLAAIAVLRRLLARCISSPAILRPLTIILTTWKSMALMVMILSVFWLLFHHRRFSQGLALFSPIGRMSLSNYVMQSGLGAVVFYGCGMGLYKYTGATLSVLIGIILSVFQGLFSAWWMKRHRQGPLEAIWHRLTWFEARKPVNG